MGEEINTKRGSDLEMIKRQQNGETTMIERWTNDSVLAVGSMSHYSFVFKSICFFR